MDNKSTSEWWGRQGAIFASLAAVGTIILLALGADWARDVSLARQAINAAPEATCSGDQTECSKKDLPAQVRAARAAEAMVDLAVWQLIVSGIALFGVAGLFWNIVQGHTALERAADANRIAKDIGEAQVRCYVHITSVVLNTYGSEPTLVFTVANTGQSPARNVAISLRCLVADIANEVLAADPASFLDTFGGPVEIAAGQADEIRQIPTPAVLAQVNRLGTTQLQFATRIASTDVFGRREIRTQFWSLLLVNGGIGRPSIVEVGNLFAMDRHDAADQ